MLPGDGDISDPDLAFVASANFNRIVLLRRDEMKASLFFVLLLIVDAFQNDVRFCRFCDSHHFDILFVVAHDLREGAFADLAFEFGEVVALGDPLDLFFDFAVDPCFEASYMDHSAASLAITGGNQRVCLCFLVAQTDLAVILSLFQSLLMLGLQFLNLENSFGFFKVVSVSERKGAILVFRFNHHVLNPSEFDHISWAQVWEKCTQRIAYIDAIFAKISDNQIGSSIQVGFLFGFVLLLEVVLELELRHPFGLVDYHFDHEGIVGVILVFSIDVEDLHDLNLYCV